MWIPTKSLIRVFKKFRIRIHEIGWRIRITRQPKNKIPEKKIWNIPIKVLYLYRYQIIKYKNKKNELLNSTDV